MVADAVVTTKSYGHRANTVTTERNSRGVPSIRAASHQASIREAEGETSALVMVVAVFLGIAVAVMAMVGLWLAISASNARDDAQAAAAKVGATSHGDSRCAPACRLRNRHARNAELCRHCSCQRGRARSRTHGLPGSTAGAADRGRATVKMGIEHGTVSIAPGIQYASWTFDGRAPGPVIHVREGQTVKVTMTNNAPMPHSIDFHAARIAPNVAFRDIAPGK